MSTLNPPSTTHQSSSKARTQAHSRIPFTAQVRSGYHRVWYEASQALRWSRRKFHGRSAGTLMHLTNDQYQRVEELAATYSRRFEESLSPHTAFLNYVYLDMLDRAKDALNWSPPLGQQTCDLGSANFAYAAALHTFFQPARLVGVEVEGHRLNSNGRRSIDEARNHIHNLPHTEYVVADYRDHHQPAHLMTAWFPFITPQALLAWGLPLRFFDPSALLTRVANNLICGGTFVMINHSQIETTMAHHFVEATGLVCRGRYVHTHPLQPRSQPAVLSLWHQS